MLRKILLGLALIATVYGMVYLTFLAALKEQGIRDKQYCSQWEKAKPHTPLLPEKPDFCR